MAPTYFLAAAFFFAGLAALAVAALSRWTPLFFASRALSFRCRVRRRIFIDRRLSLLPIGPQYLFASELSSQAVARAVNTGTGLSVIVTGGRPC